MREYLFRGKRIDDEEWIYGRFSYGEKIGTEFEPVIVAKECGEHSGVRYTVTHPIMIDTLGQYTGQKDKHGIRIFEGDILEGREFNSKHGYGVVRWDEENSCFECVQKNTDGETVRSDFGWLNFNELEVTGTVYDNPELITREASE